MGKARTNSQKRGAKRAGRKRVEPLIRLANSAAASLEPDTRDLTGRVFGDPPTWRSALAQKMRENGQ
ncbi:MAG TPA: hypothetical protein VEA41_23415 [Salinarimonas sp.]|nr:hypothetical protein [Salinarimonas sp.]